MKKKQLESVIEKAIKDNNLELLEKIDQQLSRITMKNDNHYQKLKIANYGKGIGKGFYSDFSGVPSGHRNILIWIPKKSKFMYYRESLDKPRHRMLKTRFEALGYENI